MGALVTNNASATLASGITNVGTTITLTGGQGALFPAITGSNYFYATLADSSNNIEIVKVTARSTDTITATRGAEGTTARAYSAGDRFELRPTAALFTEKVSNAGTALTSTRVPYATTGGDLVDSANMTFDGTTLTVAGFSNTGNTVLGNAAGDALTFHPSAWTLSNAVTVTGTWTNLGTVTTADINGGTLDGVTIGGASAAAATVTTFTATGVASFADGAVGAPGITFASDTDSGLYRIGANNIGVAVNGAKVLDVATTGLAVTGNLYASQTIRAEGASTPASGAGVEIIYSGSVGQIYAYDRTGAAAKNLNLGLGTVLINPNTTQVGIGSTATIHGQYEGLSVDEAGLNGYSGIALHSNVSIANGGTLVPSIVNTAALIMVQYYTSGSNYHAAVFFCSYASGTVTIVADPAGVFANSDTGGKACVFKSAASADVTIKNNLGGTYPFSVQALRGMGQ